MSNEVKKIWDIKLDDIQLECSHKASKLLAQWNVAHSHQTQRTRGHELFSKVAHGMNIFEKGRKDSFSEGSTQAMKRKIRAQTLQRVPDGEIVTQYDKNTKEQAIIEYLFKHKVLQSEYDGKDMLKQLWKTFNASYDYGYACVRTGFEKDLDGDPRISYTLIPWNDVFPSPDCKFIEEADWYIIREYIPRSTLKSLVNWDTMEVEDSTYNADVVKYLIENHVTDGEDPLSMPLADRKHGKGNTESVKVYTYYFKGKDKFITYVPSINCILREVDNLDPRKDVPLHFLILEPDPDFPLGCSSVMWTLAQQQFADAFQSTAYQTLLLALHPPLMTFGNITNPKIKMKPNAIWPMGTNPNNRIEPYRVETTTLTQYGQIEENISAKMMRSLNITDATVASDANVAKYSATPQGVEQQRLDKTITINQYQKRVEVFFAEWANHALRSYINSMSGEKQLTVDEHTRRRIFDIEKSELAKLQEGEKMPESIIDGNKIKIDFSELSADLLSFEVRSGSLIENERETERRNIQEMLIPVSQMIGNISDQNKDAFENVIMQLVMRLCEISDIDISQSTADQIGNKLMMEAMQATMNAVMGQQQQIDGIQQAMGLGQGAPQEMGQPGAPMPEAAPMPQQNGPMPSNGMVEGGQPMPPEMPPEQLPIAPETPAPMPPTEEEGEPMPEIPM